MKFTISKWQEIYFPDDVKYVIDAGFQLLTLAITKCSIFCDKNPRDPVKVLRNVRRFHRTT
jgi:hypothetical protein